MARLAVLLGSDMLECRSGSAKLIGTVAQGTPQFFRRELIHEGQGDLKRINSWFKLPPELTQKALKLDPAPFCDNVFGSAGMTIARLRIDRFHQFLFRHFAQSRVNRTVPNCGPLIGSPLFQFAANIVAMNRLFMKQNAQNE